VPASRNRRSGLPRDTGTEKRNTTLTILVRPVKRLTKEVRYIGERETRGRGGRSEREPTLSGLSSRKAAGCRTDMFALASDTCVGRSFGVPSAPSGGKAKRSEGRINRIKARERVGPQNPSQRPDPKNKTKGAAERQRGFKAGR
jgi:hypothetical protein